MKELARQSPDKQSKKLRRLRGKPLTSRTKWLTLKAAYILACVIGVITVLMFTHGLVLAIGLTVMAFFAGGLLELFALRYRDYREEWELANKNADFESGP